jgi:hypothetical protein
MEAAAIGAARGWASDGVAGISVIAIGDETMSRTGFAIRWLLTLALSGFGVYVGITRSIAIGVTAVVIALLAIWLAYAGAYPAPVDEQSRH